MHSCYPYTFISFSPSSTSQFFVTFSFPHSHLSILFGEALNFPGAISMTNNVELSTGASIVSSTSGRDRAPWNPPHIWLIAGRPVLIQVKFRKLQLLWSHYFNDCVMVRDSIYSPSSCFLSSTSYILSIPFSAVFPKPWKGCYKCPS